MSGVILRHCQGCHGLRVYASIATTVNPSHLRDGMVRPGLIPMSQPSSLAGARIPKPIGWPGGGMAHPGWGKTGVGREYVNKSYNNNNNNTLSIYIDVKNT